MPIVTVQKLIDADIDVDNLAKILNEFEIVTTRYGGDKLSVDQALSQIVVGDVTVYSAAATYTLITDWVEYSGAMYRPLPSQLPIGPEVFDSAKWSPVNGLNAGNISATINGTTTDVELWANALHVDDYASLESNMSSGVYGIGAVVIVRSPSGPYGIIEAEGANVANVGTVRVAGGQAWVRKYEGNPDPLWFNAVSDGTTSDAALLNTLTGSYELTPFYGSYGLDAPIFIDNDIDGGSYNYNAGISQAFVFATDNVALRNAVITSDNHGIQNTSVTRGTNLLFTKITADGYGVLYNDSSNGSSKSRIAFNDIYSDTADAIELNNPSTDSASYMVIGNFLHADANGTSSNSGFSIGTAGVNGHLVLGNYSIESRQEAYHTEDSQHMGLQVANIYDGCLDDGTFISGQFEGEPTADGLVSVANRYRHTAFLGASVGMYYAFPTSNGSLDMCSSVANYMDAFGTGIYLSSKVLGYHGGNVIVDATTAIKQNLSSISIGDNISKGATTLFEGEGASLVGGIHSKDKPTNVVVNSGAATQIGSAIKRFSWKTTYTHGGASATEQFDLFDAGDLFNGQINLILQNGTNNFVFSARINWNGTTLTQTDKVNKSSGNIFGTINIVEASGRVVVEVGSASAVTVGNLIVDFDGFYFVQ